VLGVVEIDGSGVRYEGPERLDAATGATLTRDGSRFALSHTAPGPRPLYYRADYGRLEFADDLTELLAPSATTEARPRPADDVLIGMVHGLALPPDATYFPGVRRLPLGSQVRVDGTGITVTRAEAPLPARDGDLTAALARVLAGLEPRYAIAYSGGLASAALALVAARNGQRPAVVHVDLDLPGPATPVPDLPGIPVERLAVPVAELLDHHQVTGEELIPPLPEVHLARRITARIAETTGMPVVSGALLKDLLAVKLPDVGTGVGGWRLLGCEPFHAAGTVRTLKQARAMVRDSTMEAAEDDPGGAPAQEPPRESAQAPPDQVAHGDDHEGLPGLTTAGQQALQSARYSILLWRQQMEGLDPAIGRLESGIEERGLRTAPTGAALPAADPRVLAAVAALPPSRLGRIRGGRFHTHLPLRELARGHGVTGLRESSSAARQRLAAARYLHQNRDKIAAELSEGCALADTGLIELERITAVLRDGPILADHALPLLRLVWVDQWLKGRS
jgi:hypothetical protein